MRQRTIRWRRALALLSVLVLALRPGMAATCAIDNVASLLADSVPAMLPRSVPRGAAPWAPFTLAQALAASAPVGLTEAAADLARTLPRRSARPRTAGPLATGARPAGTPWSTATSARAPTGSRSGATIAGRASGSLQ